MLALCLRNVAMPPQIFASQQFSPAPKDRSIVTALADVEPEKLQGLVTELSFPRSWTYEPTENIRAAHLIKDKFTSFGYTADLVGSYRNVFAYTDACKGQQAVLLCAHYDSVPNCSAADDNASAVTGLITLSEIISNHFRNLPIAFVAVNREEDGLLGSQQFAEMIVKDKSFDIAEVHNLEMIGFCSSVKGSQRLPQGLVIPGIDTGDFLALIGNDACEDAIRRILIAGRTYVPELPILALQVDKDFAQVHSDLLRSDHASFWEQGINAVQYTDTANFRNPHYHKKSDTPETLDYGFHSRVIMTVLATIVERARLLSQG